MKVDTTDVVQTIQNQIDKLELVNLKLLTHEEYGYIQGQIYALQTLQQHYQMSIDAELNALENASTEF
jgi:hypothetical protein